MLDADSSLGLETWQSLFRAALTLRDLAPWRWLEETDLFGVRDPKTGEICTCCVFGQGGEVRGLSAYRGPEGLDSLLRLLTGDFDRGRPLDSLEAYLAQRCLVVVFEDGREPDPRDRAIARRLGLESHADMPRFRSHWPGHEPCPLDPDEVALLRLVLEQAADVAGRKRHRPGLLEAPTEDVMLCRVPDLTLDGLAWRDAWVSPPPGVDADRAGFELDAARLRALRRLPFGHVASVSDTEEPIWELDFYISPTAIQDHPATRPYHPYRLLVVEHESGLVLGEDETTFEHRYGALRELLVRTIEEREVRPLGLWARRESIADAAYPLAKCAEIHIELVEDLHALEAARPSLTHDIAVGVGAI
jgi:hypothetical protein